MIGHRLSASSRAASGARARGLQTLVYGGGPMYLADIRHATDVLGERFAQIYGQGESPMTITALSKHHHADRSHPRHSERLSSVGVAHSVVEVAIRAASGEALPPGETGEVCVRGEVVMAGYWRDAAATSAGIQKGSSDRDSASASTARAIAPASRAAFSGSGRSGA